MIVSWVPVVVLSLLSVGASASDLGPIRVTFKTLDCAGEHGSASVAADRIERIEPYTCPDAPARKLKRVLARAPGGSYDAYIVHVAEAEQIQRRIDRVMESRRRALESTPRVILDHD
jgi:hypothetical protein